MYCAGGTDVNFCKVGQYSSGGASACTECGAGKFSPSPGSSSCQSCLAGYSAPSAGMSACQECSAGTFSHAGHSACTACLEGTYAPSSGSTSCILCSPGTYSASRSSTTCQACPAGTAEPLLSQTSCSVTCGPGNGSAAGSSQCRPCEPGTHQPEPGGAYPCPACPAGKTQLLPGQASCHDCGPGLWWPPGNATCSWQPCTTCDPGEYVTPATVCYNGTTPSQQACSPCASACTGGSPRPINACPGTGYIPLANCGFNPESNKGIHCFANHRISTSPPQNLTIAGSPITVAMPPQYIGTVRAYAGLGAASERGYVLYKGGVNTTVAPLGMPPIAHAVFGPHPAGRIIHSTAGAHPELYLVEKSGKVWVAGHPWASPVLLSELSPGSPPTSIDRASVVECAALPYDPSLQVPPPVDAARLVCTFDAEEAGAAPRHAFLTTIGGGASSPARRDYLHPRLSPAPEVSRGIFYDHVHNELYWSVAPRGDVYGGTVLRVFLTASYHLDEARPDGGAPEAVAALAGFTLRGAAVEPSTGKIYFYRRDYGISNGRVISQYRYNLYSWDRVSKPRALGDVNAREVEYPPLPGSQVPLTEYIFPVGIAIREMLYYTMSGLKAEDLVPSSPRVHIDVDGAMTATAIAGSPRSMHLFTPGACEPCEPDRYSPGGDSGALDCRCTDGRYYNVATGSCEPHRKCPAGSYKNFTGNHTHDAQCTSCTPCASGQYMLGCDDPVDNAQDRVRCLDCTPCTEFRFAIDARPGLCDGTGFSDRDQSDPTTCAQCPPCGDFQYISEKCNPGLPISNHECADCKMPCGVGKYIVDADNCNGYGTPDAFECGKCTECLGETVPGLDSFCDGYTRSADQRCVACNVSACDALGGYRSGGCNATAPAPECSACRPPCQEGEVEANACNGKGQDRICEKCAPCPAGHYLDTAQSCNATHSTCVPCRSSCPLEGYYLASPCPGGGGDAFRDTTECLPCLPTCGLGSYMTSTCPAGGNQTHDAVTCSPCEACPYGEYESVRCPGSGTNPEARTCSDCLACAAGEHRSAVNPGVAYCDPVTGRTACHPCTPCHGNASSVASEPCDGLGSESDQRCVTCAEALGGACLPGFYAALVAEASAGENANASACACTACQRAEPGCRPGEYVAGCDGTGVGEGGTRCETCDPCPEHHHAEVPCGGGGFTPLQGCAACECGDYGEGGACQGEDPPAGLCGAPATPPPPPQPPQTTPGPPQTTPGPPQTTPGPPQTTPEPPRTTPPGDAPGGIGVGATAGIVVGVVSFVVAAAALGMFLSAPAVSSAAAGGAASGATPSAVAVEPGEIMAAALHAQCAMGSLEALDRAHAEKMKRFRV